MIARLARTARRSRSAAAVVTLLACTAIAVWQAVLFWHARQDTRLMADLAADMDREPGRHASARILLARANYLLRHERLEEAQNLGDAPTVRKAPAIRAAIYYNLANARLRMALPMLSRQQTDRALSLIGLAKEEYRHALRLTPGDWNIRYNLDYAMRMVQDSPRLQLQQEGELERQPSRKQSWTDLPSLPKGLP
jgi:mxaK protein